MTPTLMGRLETRILLTSTIGLLWTALITLALPLPVGTGISAAYRMTFAGVGLMAALGLLWELLYHLFQQFRWDKDWPSLFALITVVNEAIVLWYVEHWLGVLPGTTALTSPLLPAFGAHIGSTWVLFWLVQQGPLRVVLPRWRFDGARVIGGREHRSRIRVSSCVAETGDQEPAGQEAGCLVVEGDRPSAGEYEPIEGVRCQRGHLCYGGATYCLLCGVALAPPTSQPTETGPRPPLGMLIFADGTTKVLEGDVKIETKPSGGLSIVNADEPRSEKDEVGPLAEITLVGWQPVLSGKVTCTRVDLPGGSRLEATRNVPVPLVPGMEFVLDGQAVRYEGPHLADETISAEPPADVRATPAMEIRGNPGVGTRRKEPAAVRAWPPQLVAGMSAAGLLMATSAAAAFAAVLEATIGSH